MAGPAPWWEHIPTPTPHHLNHPTSRCLRMQRISGAKAAHFLWPGDRLSHTDPLLAALILGSSAYPIRKRQLGPHNLGLTFLCLLEAEEIGRVQITQDPLPWKSGFNLKAMGSLDSGLQQDPGSWGLQKGHP